ncbi:YIF1-domain-containing protein [Pseudomassariella vexata]|uniref:Protein YIF1 n=1 Tax=Pseudomassariella vexata TaxID=1141098 RepID=A0A1Y2D9G3_9PEZI|nr:YIF1-domain-containing protein [Pseudomassariella vexata]ORY55295.1 YIF1-domain-containing protein [Pseudomassariella vexata]
MQRQNYGHSPPLHHPVPQHVSTVPQLRSPPPPISSQPQTQGAYGNPYQQGQPGQPGAAGGNMFGQYGNFMNDPTTQFAATMGQNAFKHGQEYFEQNAKRWINMPALKHYFNVSNSYVVNKLYLVLFPWLHKPWSRKQTVGPNGQEGWFLPPRDDINSPDMYIPLMALVTYVLLSSFLAGIRGQFDPQLLGGTAVTAAVIVGVEIALLKLGCYFLGINNESQLLDLVAYSGYKFVGVIVTVAIAELFTGGKGAGGWVGWMLFMYTFSANAYFLLRSLRYVLLAESTGDVRGSMQTNTRSQRTQRTTFLFGYAYPVQLVFMWILSRL